jgi:hypothetical protein
MIPCAAFLEIACAFKERSRSWSKAASGVDMANVGRSAPAPTPRCPPYRCPHPIPRRPRRDRDRRLHSRLPVPACFRSAGPTGCQSCDTLTGLTVSAIGHLRFRSRPAATGRFSRPPGTIRGARRRGFAPALPADGSRGVKPGRPRNAVRLWPHGGTILELTERNSCTPARYAP